MFLVCKTKASPEQVKGTELEVNSTPTQSLWTGPLVSNFHLCSVEGSGPINPNRPHYTQTLRTTTLEVKPFGKMLIFDEVRNHKIPRRCGSQVWRHWFLLLCRLKMLRNLHQCPSTCSSNLSMSRAGTHASLEHISLRNTQCSG